MVVTIEYLYYTIIWASVFGHSANFVVQGQFACKGCISVGG